MNKQEKIYIIYSVIANAVFYAFFGVFFFEAAFYRGILDCFVLIFVGYSLWFYLPVLISLLWGGWLWFKEKSRSRLVKLMFYISLLAVVLGSLLLFIQIYGKRVGTFMPDDPLVVQRLQERCWFIKITPY